MRTWIALATYDERGEREYTIGDLDNLDKVHVFQASDDMPSDDDLTAAFADWDFGGDSQELILVPLDAGMRVAMSTTKTTTVEVVVRETV